MSNSNATPGPSTCSKRKAEDELSQNPNTVRARKRINMIAQDPNLILVEKAKAADQGAVTYAKKKLLQSQEYKDASDQRKAELIEKSAATVRLKRERDNKDWKCVAKKLGVGDEGGLYATEDDGNPAWEDIEYNSDEDAEFEAMWKRDEQINDEKPQNATSQEIAEAGKLAYAQRAQEAKEREFRLWQRFWRSAFRTFRKKVRLLDERGEQSLIDRPVKLPSGKVWVWTGPGNAFTTAEKAVWRNCSVWMVEEDEDVVLPGPAGWWPVDSAIIEAGFDFPTTKTGFKEAFILMQRTDVSYDDLFDRVAPGDQDLRVMEDTPSSKMLLEVFFGSMEGKQVIRGRLDERKSKKRK